MRSEKSISSFRGTRVNETLIPSWLSWIGTCQSRTVSSPIDISCMGGQNSVSWFVVDIYVKARGGGVIIIVLVANLGLLICSLAHTLSRIFVHSFQAKAGEKTVGVVVCKADGESGLNMEMRGYIAMLAVDTHHRRRGIGIHCIRAIAVFQQMTDALHFSPSP